MDKIKVFLDSDVLISALLSKTGASFEILRNSKITKVISKAIETEVHDVIARLNLDTQPNDVLQDIEIVTLKLEKARLSKMYVSYVIDEEDSHVVAGAMKAKVKFLLTHNIRHYHVVRIKNNLELNVMKPGLFLQYLRNLEK